MTRFVQFPYLRAIRIAQITPKIGDIQIASTVELQPPTSVEGGGDSGNYNLSRQCLGQKE